MKRYDFGKLSTIVAVFGGATLSVEEKSSFDNRSGRVVCLTGPMADELLPPLAD